MEIEIKETLNRELKEEGLMLTATRFNDKERLNSIIKRLIEIKETDLTATTRRDNVIQQIDKNIDNKMVKDYLVSEIKKNWRKIN